FDQYQYNHKIIIFKENGDTEELGSTNFQFESYNAICNYGNTSHGIFDQENYKASITSNNTLSVTKRNCYDLYLCKQAIKNSQKTKETLKKVIQSQSYKQLTNYEKDMVNKKINKKINPLITHK